MQSVVYHFIANSMCIYTSISYMALKRLRIVIKNLAKPLKHL